MIQLNSTDRYRLLELQFGFHIQGFLMQLNTMITRAQQQRNATAIQLNSSDFFVRRLEEYERTLSVLTTRIEQSYAQEINLIGYLQQLLCILNELRCHFQGITEEPERDMDWFEESATQSIVTITRNGEVGRPRLALAREQLETLRGTVVLQLPRDIVVRLRYKVTGVSSRLS